MLEGYRTYLTAIAQFIYNVGLPMLGVKGWEFTEIDMLINAVFTVGIIIFRKIAKPKV